MIWTLHDFRFELLELRTLTQPLTYTLRNAPIGNEQSARRVHINGLHEVINAIDSLLKHGYETIGAPKYNDVIGAAHLAVARTFFQRLVEDIVGGVQLSELATSIEQHCFRFNSLEVSGSTAVLKTLGSEQSPQARNWYIEALSERGATLESIAWQHSLGAYIAFLHGLDLYSWSNYDHQPGNTNDLKKVLCRLDEDPALRDAFLEKPLGWFSSRKEHRGDILIDLGLFLNPSAAQQSTLRSLAADWQIETRSLVYAAAALAKD